MPKKKPQPKTHKSKFTTTNFSELRKRARTIKERQVREDGNNYPRRKTGRSLRRIEVVKQELERYVNENNISGKLRENILELGDKNHDKRKNAIKKLEEKEDERAVLPLIAMLKDPDLRVRFYAGIALGKIGDERALPALIREATNPENDPRAYLQAINELGVYEKAVPELFKGMKGQSYYHKNFFAKIAGFIDKKRASNWREFLEKGRKDMREFSAWALGEIKERNNKTIKLLEKALNKDLKEVKGHAGIALGKIGGRKAVTALRKAMESKNKWTRINAQRGMEIVERKK